MKQKGYYRSELDTLLLQVNAGSKINEIPLFGTRLKIYIFHLRNRDFFCLRDLVDIFDYFFKISNPMEFYRYIRSVVFVERLGALDDTMENRDLEIICSEYLTDDLFEDIREKFGSPGHCGRTSTMPEYSTIPFFSEKSFLMSEDEHQNSPVQEMSSFHPQDAVSGMCPFREQWTEKIMDGILQNIYCGDSEKDIRPSGIKRNMGRGRSPGKAENIKDRPFICKYEGCKRAFKRLEHLKRHNLMHTGERPFKCKYPGCLKAFSRSDNLSQHYKIHSISDEAHMKSYRSFRYINKELN
jgi:zinc-finger protein CreA/MIG